MKTTYLFPSKYKKPGWIITILAFIIAILTELGFSEPEWLDVQVLALFKDEFMVADSFQWIGWMKNNILNEILGCLLIVGLLLVAFSKEKDEDELIRKMRLESLVWATYWSYGFLFVAMVLVYDIVFFQFMIYNMFTLPIFFIGKFHWQLFKFRKSAKNEE